MANTYKSIYLQIIFAVKNRDALLSPNWRADIFKYIAGILNQRGHYSLAVNGHMDHIHIFFDYNTKELISDLVREIKKSTSNYIKKNRLSPYHFEWQSGYGVFSHGYREKDIIIKYVMNQEEHHRTRSFKEEYLSFLKSYEIDFKDEYLFDFLIDYK
jgi:REP element-mobilizing transposase RayT